jgi:AAHS family 4-hydroxybenzoate transporter-like MFS transporter
MVIAMLPVNQGFPSRGPNLAFALGLLCMILEGYDTYCVSYVGPVLMSLWSLAPAKLGVLFTSGVVGSAIAYIAIGPLTHHLGRRWPVIIGTACFGAATLGCSSAQGADSFIAWRVAAGLALGAVLPNIVALVAECLPGRNRSLAVVVLYSGFGIGSMLAGLVARQLLPTYGWQSVFIAGGIAPLLLAPSCCGACQSPQYCSRDQSGSNATRSRSCSGMDASRAPC